MSANRRTALAAMVAAAWSAAGCNNAERYTGTARLRLINASTGYETLDQYVDDRRTHAGVGRNQGSGYEDVDAGGVTTTLRLGGGGTNLTVNDRTLVDGGTYTVVAYGVSGALKTVLLREDEASAGASRSRLRVMNMATDAAGSLDVYLTGSDDALATATATAAGLSDPAAAVFTTVGSGSYRLRVAGAGSKTDLRLDRSVLALGSQSVYTLLLTPGAGGVLVNAVLVPQQADLVPLANTQARVRVVSSVAGDSPVTADVAGVRLLDNVASGTSGDYGLVTAGTAAVALTVAGTAVAAASRSLEAGTDHTLLVWGPADAPTVAWFTDDNALPATGKAKLRLVHALNGHTGVLQLRVGNVSLVSNVAQGQVSAYGTLTGSSAALVQVTSASRGLVYPASETTTTTAAALSVQTVFVLGSTDTAVNAYIQQDR